MEMSKKTYCDIFVCLICSNSNTWYACGKNKKTNKTSNSNNVRFWGQTRSMFVGELPIETNDFFKESIFEFFNRSTTTQQQN